MMQKQDMAEKLESIEEMTTNVDAVQERVLAEILARNGDAEYLARCGLAGVADRATFRAKVPVVTYEDLKPYILRVANGDTSPVLTGNGHPISEFVVSSGTSSGEPKLIPAVKDEVHRRMLLHSFITAVMNQHVPGLDKGSGLYFNFVKSATTTPGGLPARTVVTSLLHSDHYRRRPYEPTSRGGHTSPTAAVLCEDASQSMYAQMLCGLCHRHAVLRIGATFAYGLVRAVSFLQRNWRHLADDIEAGKLVSQRVTDPSVCAAVAGVLRPDPDLARFVRTERGGGDDCCWGTGILTRLWPNAKYLDAICTGTMAQYVPTLRYFSGGGGGGGGGGVPIVSTIYGSSECYFGINLRPISGDDDPAEATYTIMPNMAYFEFLPTDAAAGADGTANQLVELARVEAGHEYELVVTTYGGLYRYRVGDVLHVAGFHNAAPEFQFVRRGNVVLSVDVDKTDEAELQRTVERASAALLVPRGAAVLDYTARTCTETVPGHYVVYWELRMLSLSSGTAAAERMMSTGGVVDGDVLGRCCLEMEEALNYSYREGRVSTGSIGPLEIRVLRSGTFEELADYAVVSCGASVGQYKVPRCVTVPAVVEMLESRVVSRHLSPALPHWELGLRLEEDTIIS